MLTRDQIDQATLLRQVSGLSIASIAAELKVNRETLREQFVRDGTVPLPPLDAPTAAPTATPIEDASTIDVDDAGFPANTPRTNSEAFAAPPPSLESIRSAWAAERAADLRDGWATDFAVADLLRRQDPLR